MIYNSQQCIIEGKARQCKVKGFEDMLICERGKGDRCGSRLGKELCTQSKFFGKQLNPEPAFVTSRGDMALSPIGRLEFTAEGKKTIFKQNAVGL